MGYWGVVLNALKNSDVILLIADSRLPSLSLNEEIIKKSQTLNKELIVIFNKIDLIPRRLLEEIRNKNSNALFFSAKTKEGMSELKNKLKNLRNSKGKKLRVGIFGYPNVGKSAILNLLSPNSKAKVSNIPGTTKKASYETFENLRFIDTPGVIPQNDSEQIVSILSSKDPGKLKKVEKSAIHLIEFLIKEYPSSIESTYQIKETNPSEIFFSIGKKKGFLQKGGVVDEERTAIKILKDWQEGKVNLS